MTVSAEKDLEAVTIQEFLEAVKKAKTKWNGIIVLPVSAGTTSEAIQERIKKIRIIDKDGASYFPPVLNVGWAAPNGTFSFTPNYQSEDLASVLDKIEQINKLAEERDRKLCTFELGESVRWYDEKGELKTEWVLTVVEQDKKKIKFKYGPGLPFRKNRKDIDFLCKDEDPEKEWIEKSPEAYARIQAEYEAAVRAIK